MKSFIRRSGKAVLVSLILCLIALVSAPRAMAIPDANNLGKGDWIWLMASAQKAMGVADVQGVINYEKAKGMQFIVVKCATTGTWMSQFNQDLVDRCHAAGLLIFGYERCNGDDVFNEANCGSWCLDLGADGFIIDAEIEYEGKNAQAVDMMNQLRGYYPDAFIGLTTFTYIDYHTRFPYVEFLSRCNVVMPQDYWKAMGKTTAQMVADTDTQWKKWQDKWVSQGNAAAVKPIAPIAQAYDAVPGSEILAFVNALRNDAGPATAGGYKSVSFWSAQHHNADEWNAIGQAYIGGNAEIVLDNSQYGFAASANWATGTSAADKYGANYRYRGTGAVSDSASWTFALGNAGNYEISAWWSRGSNRAASATYVAPAGANVRVNQQLNGGMWNSLGVYSLGSGAQTVKLSCWTTTGYCVVADAIKLTPR